jgi:hypothetical protein
MGSRGTVVVRLVPVGSFPLALPTILVKDWCHEECYQLWAAKDIIDRGVIGGHIHYDKESESWQVPFKVAIKEIGVISPNGVARLHS